MPTRTTISTVLRQQRSRSRALARACKGLACAIALLTAPQAAPAAGEPPAAAAAPAAPARLAVPERDAEVPRPRAPGPVSGLPVPRYVSLKSGRINVRRGPGPDYPVEWVFEKRGLPVEITAESSRWRRIRDREGDVGWVWHSMLDGRRTAIVEGRNGDTQPVALLAEPNPSAPIIAYAEPGVIAQITACKGKWCELKASGYEGWIERAALWGTYPDEDFE